MNPQNILVVDNNEKIRLFLKTLLEANGYSVILAKDLWAALEMVQSLQLDLIILDVFIPKIEGWDGYRQTHMNGLIPVVYLGDTNQKDSIISEQNLGEDDYVVNPFDPFELVAKINTILAQKTQNTDQVDNNESLSNQEINILQLIDKGFTNKEIAVKLFLTEGTVKVYNYIIFQKLQVKNRTQAVVRAKKLNLI